MGFTGTAPDDVWAVGHLGRPAHRVDGRWVTATLPTAATPGAIHGRCATDAWAVGERGTLLRLTP